MTRRKGKIYNLLVVADPPHSHKRSAGAPHGVLPVLLIEKSKHNQLRSKKKNLAVTLLLRPPPKKTKIAKVTARKVSEPFREASPPRKKNIQPPRSSGHRQDRTGQTKKSAPRAGDQLPRY